MINILIFNDKNEDLIKENYNRLTVINPLPIALKY